MSEERKRRVEPQKDEIVSNKYYVYIIKCKNGSYYVGHSGDIKRRMKDHQAGYGSKFTMDNEAEVPLYYEEFALRSEAMKREPQLKKWSRAKKEALIKGDLNKLHELSKIRKRK